MQRLLRLFWKSMIYTFLVPYITWTGHHGSWLEGTTRFPLSGSIHPSISRSLLPSLPPLVHTFSFPYLGPGSSLCKDSQTFLSPATSSSSPGEYRGIPGQPRGKVSPWVFSREVPRRTRCPSQLSWVHSVWKSRGLHPNFLSLSPGEKVPYPVSTGASSPPVEAAHFSKLCPATCSFSHNQ